MSTRQVVIELPEKVLRAANTDESDFARELRTLAAVKLYELGRLSTGRAAELATMSRVEFLLGLERSKVFPLHAEVKRSGEPEYLKRSAIRHPCCFCIELTH